MIIVKNEINLDNFINQTLIFIGVGGKVSSTTSIPILLHVPKTIRITASTSCIFKSGSISYLILAIS